MILYVVFFRHHKKNKSKKRKHEDDEESLNLIDTNKHGGWYKIARFGEVILIKCIVLRV